MTENFVKIFSKKAKLKSLEPLKPRRIIKKTIRDEEDTPKTLNIDFNKKCDDIIFSLKIIENNVNRLKKEINEILRRIK